MLGFYNYTVILTYISLASSIFGVFAAINGNVFASIIALLFSGFCDMFDGKVARTMKRNKSEQRFGIQIDSLCDLVCFGVLPSIIGYAIGLKKWYHLPILILYPLAALIRLAYFNVIEEERQDKTTEKRTSYLGLPVTSAALIIPFVYSFKPLLINVFPVVYLITLCIVALLFVLKFNVVKPGNKGMILLGLLGVIDVILIILLWK